MSRQARMRFTLWCGTEDKADAAALEPLNDRLVMITSVELSELELTAISVQLADAVAMHGPDGWGCLVLDNTIRAARFVERSFGVPVSEYFVEGRVWLLERLS